MAVSLQDAVLLLVYTIQSSHYPYHKRRVFNLFAAVTTKRQVTTILFLFVSPTLLFDNLKYTTYSEKLGSFQ
jgi:hypothetical protein